MTAEDAEKFCTANLVSCPSNSASIAFLQFFPRVLDFLLRVLVMADDNSPGAKSLFFGFFNIANALSVGDVEFKLYFFYLEFLFYAQTIFAHPHPNLGDDLH